MCRSTLPALNAGARITVRRIETGPVPRSLQVEYEAALPGRPILERSVICRFAAEGLSPNKAELIEIVTEQGPLSGASLYLLKRYYLDSPEGVAGDPGSPPALTAAEIPPTAAYLLQQLLSGLPRTAIYGLLAVAYSLVFGLTGRINLAFGEIAAIGSAATVAAASIVIATGSSAPLAGLAAGLVAAMFAGAIYNAVGGFFVIGKIQHPEQPAEPDRHRGVVPFPDGISAAGAEPGNRVAAAGLVHAMARREGGRFPRDADAPIARHLGYRACQRGLSNLADALEHFRAILARLCG